MQQPDRRMADDAGTGSISSSGFVDSIKYYSTTTTTSSTRSLETPPHALELGGAVDLPALFPLLTSSRSPQSTTSQGGAEFSLALELMGTFDMEPKECDEFYA